MNFDMASSHFMRIISAMGASQTNWWPGEGKLITPEIIEKGPGGSILGDGDPVLLYIKDHGWRQEVLDDAKNGNKVHFMHCHTIERFTQEARIDRYVSTRRLARPWFIEVLNSYGSGSKEYEANLHICQNCLKMREQHTGRHKSQAERRQDAITLEPGIILNDIRSRLPATRYSDETAPPIGYSENWSEESKAYRESQNWRCEYCHVDCSSQKGLLDAHHINGVKQDNSRGNLRALCKLCHCKQPAHQHMQVSSSEEAAIIGLRRAQRNFNNR